MSAWNRGESLTTVVVRVLQIPTPRHSLYDALALSMDAPTEGPSVIQERAFTSPIWYTP